MATINRPRIVVEQSPWQTMFEQLPDLVLSFHRLKLKAEEEEKNRRFVRSNMYIKDLQDTKKIYLDASLKAAETASSKGIAMDTALFKLSKSSPEARTKGGDNLNQFFQIDVLEGQINNLETGIEDINNQLMLASQGEKAAMVIDQNFNSKIDPLEIEQYQKDNPQLLKDLGVDRLPEAFVRGAETILTDPKVRKQQRENAGVFATLNIMQDWTDDANLTQDQLNERNQARIAAMIPGQSDKMIDHVIKSYKVEVPDKTEAEVAADLEAENFEDMKKDADKIFRTNMDIFQEQITRTSPKLQEELAWGAGQDLKEGGFILSVDTHRENIEKTFEKWFTKSEWFGPDTKSSIRNTYKDYFSAASGTEDQKREEAVAKTLTDPVLEKIMAKDDLIKKSFGWHGSDDEKEAAVQTFRTMYDMYNQASEWSGRVSGGGIAKMLEQQGIKKRTDINIDPVEDDWLYRERITK